MSATNLHGVEIRHEACTGPSQAGHRAHCSCGWSSDCWAQLSDAERATDVHLRRSKTEEFAALIARSSIGQALADIKERGIDAHLGDLEREMAPKRRKRKAR